MEEQIFEILVKNFTDERHKNPVFLSAKEITSYIMEFIEWFGKNCYLVNENEYSLRMSDIRFYNEIDAYQYWLNNLKK